jgi:hypothetical protein
MRNEAHHFAILIAMLSVVFAGCAVQGDVTADSSAPAVGTSRSAPSPVQAAAAPSVAASGLPEMAASAPPGGSAAPQLPATRSQLPPPTDDESRYGIQVAQVGMAAAGGLVDLRLKVLDAAKATKLLGNPANVPVLIAGDAPPLQPPHHALRGARYSNGLVFYILYPNVRNAVTPGTEITVAMGDVRLGPVTVR